MLLDHQNCTPGIFVLKANCTFFSTLFIGGLMVTIVSLLLRLVLLLSILLLFFPTTPFYHSVLDAPFLCI